MSGPIGPGVASTERVMFFVRNVRPVSPLLARKAFVAASGALRLFGTRLASRVKRAAGTFAVRSSFKSPVDHDGSPDDADSDDNIYDKILHGYLISGSEQTSDLIHDKRHKPCQTRRVEKRKGGP